jgi:predicted MFS family arabinose efflux permease
MRAEVVSIATRRPAWVAMIAFAGVGGVTQLLWLTYAPITSDAAAHYGVSETAIGWLANVFPLWYVVLAIPVGLALARWLRGTVALGAVLTAAGAIVRLLDDSYAAAMAGQTLVALAQPLVVTAITPMAARYLAERDRAKGIAFATASTFAGMIVAFGLSTAVSLTVALRIDAVGAVACAVALTLALRSRPAFAEPRASSAIADFREAWRNPVVRRMCLLVPVPFGTFTALTTWAEPLLEPAGVTTDQAGLMLLLNVLAGVVGCAVIPVWAAEHGRRRTALLAGVAVTVAGCVLLAVAPSFALGVVAFLVIGLLLLAALPIVLELSERAAGRAAGAAAGLVWMAGQLGALVVTGAAGAMVDVPTVCFLFLAVVTAAVVPALPRREPATG